MTDRHGFEEPIESVVQAVDNRFAIFVFAHGGRDRVRLNDRFEVRRAGDSVGFVIIDQVFTRHAVADRESGSKAFAVHVGDTVLRDGTGVAASKPRAFLSPMQDGCAAPGRAMTPEMWKEWAERGPFNSGGSSHESIAKLRRHLAATMVELEETTGRPGTPR